MEPKNIHYESYIHLYKHHLILVDSQYKAQIWGQNQFQGKKQLPPESLLLFKWVTFKQFHFATN